MLSDSLLAKNHSDRFFKSIVRESLVDLKFCDAKVSEVKESAPARWWKEIKNLMASPSKLQTQRMLCSIIWKLTQSIWLFQDLARIN